VDDLVSHPCLVDDLRRDQLTFGWLRGLLSPGIPLGIVCLLLTACEQPEVQQQSSAYAPAQRIVSLAPHITEVVFAAGAGKYLVGAVEYSDYPQAALEVPRVGDAFRIDYEALAVLEPDLVLVWESGNPPEVVQRLVELGYRVVALEPRDLDSVVEQLERVGRLAGTSVVADLSAAELRQRIARLRAMQKPNERPAVFWQISVDPLFTVSDQHLVNQVIEMCGGRNVFASLAGLAPTVSLEAVITAQPDVIIAAMPSDDTAWETMWQRWTEVPAVSNKQLYSVHPDLVSRPGPRIVEGAAQVCEVLRAVER
jgi:iron complex transport system substrate-binding protein